MKESGKLFVVSVPIGNIGDITYHAIEILKNCDFIACEDTRVSGRLLKEYNIKNNLISFFEHNEDYKLNIIIEHLKNGRNIALISDAGTPLISDPGFKLVRQLRDLGFEVQACPGATSPICALTLSGFATDKFIFIGFLPAKDGPKEKILQKYLSLNNTLICFESPYRILFTLELLKKMKLENEICVCREMTKKYQEIISGKVLEVLQKLQSKDAIKGEIVLLINKTDEVVSNNIEDYKDDILKLFKDKKSVKDIVGFFVENYNFKKSEIYDYINSIKNS